MNSINIPLTHQWMMIIDEGHFLIKQTIKDFTYNDLSSLLNLQNQLKDIVDNLVKNLNIMEYNNNFKKITYILTSFCDNLFLIYGPSESYFWWCQNSMEKNYFNSLTSGYIFRQDIDNYIKNQENLPEFLVYSYWLFFESLNNNNLYNYQLKDFFWNNIKKNIIKKIPIDNPLFINKNFIQLKINFFNYLMFLVAIIIILIINKKIYWYWINKIIPTII
jgi:hypothetical protein